MRGIRVCSVFVLALLCDYSYGGRKIINPYDKASSVNFLNMEGGGASRPSGNQPRQPTSTGPVLQKPSIQSPAQNQQQNYPAPAPASPIPSTPVNVKQPTPTAPKQYPAVQQTSNPNPGLNNHPAVHPMTPNTKPIHSGPQQPGYSSPQPTPGPGKVKDLINYYDSKGKFSSNSYKQAVTGLQAN